MNFATIKAFVKKHTQSPEEYITEFDDEEMNEWLQAIHSEEMDKLSALGIKMAFIECVDVEKKVGMSNDFWLVLMPADGRFSIRQFAEGSPQAKNLVGSAFKAAPALAAANARVAKAFPQDVFIFQGARSVYFNDWVVDIASKSIESIGCYKNQNFVDVATDYLETIDALCTAQENVGRLQDKGFILSKLLSNETIVPPIEMVVFDENSDLPWANSKLTGLELDPNYAIVPVAYKNNCLQAVMAVNFGHGYVPLFKDTPACLTLGNEVPAIEIGDSALLRGNQNDDGMYVAEDIFVFEFSDSDLNLKPGTLEILSMGLSPLDMLKFARGEQTPVQESYAMDFTMADQATDSGLSL